MTGERGGAIEATLAGIAAAGLFDLANTPDPLAEALHYLRMDGMFYCPSELTAPWGLELPPMSDCVWFHIVTEGECVLRPTGGAELIVRAGDIAVLAHGAGHEAFDAATSPMPLVFDLPHEYVSRHYAILRHGGGGTPTNVICGVVQLGHPAARALIDVLPEVIHVQGANDRSEWQWLPALLSLMAAETQAARPGGETVVTRLCDVLVIQAIRAWIRALTRAGWEPCATPRSAVRFR